MSSTGADPFGAEGRSRRLRQRIEAGLVRWSTQPVRLRGLALCRIGLGIAGVDLYLSNWSQRGLLWGPDGYIDSKVFGYQARALGLHSLYALSSSPAFFQALFVAGLVVATLFCVFGGRTLTVLHAVLLWSLYNRNIEILDGGDNLARILVILLVFAVSDAYYAPHASWRRQRLGLGGPLQPSVRTLVHNAAVLLVTFQIAILYFCAGAWKVAGPLWQNGTAMYDIGRAVDFRFLSLGSLTTNAVTVTALTYFAIVANLGFPFGLLTRRWRIVTVAMAATMHIGIIVVMGLTGFGITMLGADLGCLSDQEYAVMARSASGLLGRFRRPAAPSLADLAGLPSDSGAERPYAVVSEAEEGSR